MPALDNIMTGGAIHIADQNKATPIATLCGQALDKENIRYFEKRENFAQATCKVCRKSYFNEDWSGDTQTDAPKVTEEQESSGDEIADRIRNTLFSNLTTPINKHDAPSEENGDGA